MTLITLLIVMALERVTQKSPEWHIHALVTGYWQRVSTYSVLTQLSKPLMLFTLSLLPALFAYWLIEWIDVLFFTFISSLVVLWVCLGCPVTRKSYKAYLNSANKQDFQACSLHSMAFGNPDGDLDRVADQLVYVNYRQYAAVVLWFVFLGVPGLIFYSVLKELDSIQNSTSSCTEAWVQGADTPGQEALGGQSTLLRVLDWIPVRITSLGFLVVGHFSRATGVWLQSLFDFSSDAKSILSRVSTAAEDVSAGVDDCITRPCTMVSLVKRNVSFLLVFIALLTMVGAVN